MLFLEATRKNRRADWLQIKTYSSGNEDVDNTGHRRPAVSKTRWSMLLSDDRVPSTTKFEFMKNNPVQDGTGLPGTGWRDHKFTHTIGHLIEKHGVVVAQNGDTPRGPKETNPFPFHHRPDKPEKIPDHPPNRDNQ